MRTAKEMIEHLKEIKDETLNDSTPLFGESCGKAGCKEEDPIRDDKLLDKNKTKIPELSMSTYLNPEVKDEEEECPIRCGSTEKKS
jgi:hypothetical protein